MQQIDSNHNQQRNFLESLLTINKAMKTDIIWILKDHDSVVGNSTIMLQKNIRNQNGNAQDLVSSQKQCILQSLDYPNLPLASIQNRIENHYVNDQINLILQNECEMKKLELKLQNSIKTNHGIDLGEFDKLQAMKNEMFEKMKILKQFLFEYEKNCEGEEKKNLNQILIILEYLQQIMKKNTYLSQQLVSSMNNVNSMICQFNDSQNELVSDIITKFSMFKTNITSKIEAKINETSDLINTEISNLNYNETQIKQSINNIQNHSNQLSSILLQQQESIQRISRCILKQVEDRKMLRDQKKQSNLNGLNNSLDSFLLSALNIQKNEINYLVKKSVELVSINNQMAQSKSNTFQDLGSYIVQTGQNVSKITNLEATFNRDNYQDCQQFSDLFIRTFILKTLEQNDALYMRSEQIKGIRSQNTNKNDTDKLLRLVEQLLQRFESLPELENARLF